MWAGLPHSPSNTSPFSANHFVQAAGGTVSRETKIVIMIIFKLKA